MCPVCRMLLISSLSPYINDNERSKSHQKCHSNIVCSNKQKEAENLCIEEQILLF